MASTSLMPNVDHKKFAGTATTKMQILRSKSGEEYFLPEIAQKKLFRVNSERKPFCVNPYPKLKSGRLFFLNSIIF